MSTDAREVVSVALLALPFLLLGYALIGYPAILWLVCRIRPAAQVPHDFSGWPQITLTIPAFNEEASLRETLNSILALKYPADKRQILVISDASTDGTDDIAREYRDRGVELLRLAERGGKTVAENAAGKAARGELVVNIDASVRVLPDSLLPLIRAFSDPSVGVASGRDVSVRDTATDLNLGEAGYVGYEMWVRSLETRIHSIVGASGCFYATRRVLYDDRFPGELSRDFASALIAREKGLRAVSVNDAVCLVPRGRSLRAEFRRKTRTMARGLATLYHMRHLMDPEKTGVFSWMLVSHKLVRWGYYLVLPPAVCAGLILSASSAAVRLGAGMALIFCGAGAAGLLWRRESSMPKALALPAYVVATNLAGILAWWRCLSGNSNAVWEPTRRSE